MPEQSGISGFIEELHRRRVFRVAAFYGGIAFVIVQIIDGTFEVMGIPAWVSRFIIILLAIGFPVSMILAWVFDITPEGIVRTEGRATGKPGTSNLALIAVTIAAIAFGIWGRWGNLLTSESLLRSHSVVVLPFSVRGSEDIGYLSEGMVDLLSTKLDGAGNWRAVDPRAVLARVGREGGGIPNLDQGQAISENLGAGLYVLGNIVAVSERLRLDASLYNVSQGPRAVVRGTAEGDASQIFTLVDELAAQLLMGQKGGPGARVQQIAAVTTSSLPALRAYLEGESAFRDGHFETAVDAFQKAVALDDQFALAYYRLGNAARWLLRKKLPQDAAELAFRNSGRLSDHDQRLLKAFLASLSGKTREAERVYRSLVGTHPDNIEAWFELGELLFHNNPLHGRSFAESRHAFERVLFYEPDHSTSIIHLARIAASQGEREEMNNLVNRYIELSPDADRKLEMLALQAFSNPNEVAQESVVDQLQWASDVTLALAIWNVAVYANNLSAAERLASLATVSSRSSEIRTTGHIWLAHLKLARGKWKSAKIELAALEPINHVTSIEYKVLLSTLPFIPTNIAEFSALEEALISLDHTIVPDGDNPSIIFNIHDDLHSLLQIYLLGLLSVQQGDISAAARYAERINQLEIAPDHGSLAADLKLSVQAQIDRRHGQTAMALKKLEQTQMDTWYGKTMASPFFSRAYERFARAELLFELGKDKEALEWYSHLAETSPFELVYLPISHLRRGEIFERLGEPQMAIEHYTRFIDLWKGSDPEFKPLVDGAKARLAGLRDLDRSSTKSSQ